MQLSLTYYSLGVAKSFGSFGLKMTLRYRLDTATCQAFGMFS